MLLKAYDINSKSRYKFKKGNNTSKANIKLQIRCNNNFVENNVKIFERCNNRAKYLEGKL